MTIQRASGDQSRPRSSPGGSAMARSRPCSPRSPTPRRSPGSTGSSPLAIPSPRPRG